MAVPQDILNPWERHMVTFAPGYSASDRASEKVMDKNKLLSIEQLFIPNLWEM